MSRLVTRMAEAFILGEFRDKGRAHFVLDHSPAEVRLRLSGDFRFHLAEHGGELAGVAAVRGDSHLYYLFVATPYQRQGLARRLWARAREDAMARGNAGVFTVNASNYAVPAYERLGFRRTEPTQEKNGILYNPMQFGRPTRPKAIIFDLFHTLTGSESAWSTLPWTSDVLGIDRAVWDRALTAESRWRLAGEERDPFVILSRLARAVDPGITDETLHRAIEVRISRFREALLKIPAANINALTLLRLCGFRLALISNADVMEVAAWADSPLAGLFDVELFSCEAGCVKPEAEIFERCLTALKLRGHECMFVGDGGSNELVGAKAAGMTTVLVSGVIEELWPERIPERLAHADHHLKFAWEIVDLLGLTAGGEAGPRRHSSQQQ